MADDSSSSSDEDEEHNAALQSVAIDSNSVLQFANPTIPTSGRKSRCLKSSRKKSCKAAEEDNDDAGGLKLYQIRVQDLLHKYLDNSIEDNSEELAVESEVDDPVLAESAYDGEIRLFSNTSLGVSLKRSCRSKRKVRLLPPRYDSSDEDSAERDARFQAVAVEGTTIKSQAETAQAKAFTRFLAAEAADERAGKAEAEKVGRLRQERGEEWLPSIAKKLMIEIRTETERKKSMSAEGKIGVVAKYKI